MKLWQGLAIVALLWAALYLPFLGSTELRGEEARRVLPARTMLQTGDWVVPRIGGMEYSSKPPLINWTIAGVFALTGVQNEWTARVPSVLWLLAFALVATWALSKQFGVWRAATASLFFLSALGMLDKGRTAEIDAMYAAQTGIAYVLWAVWWAEGKLWRAYLVPAIFLGLGMLAKGPVHLFLFYGAVIPALWMAKRRIDLVQAPHLLSLVLIAAIFLPWMGMNLHQVKAAAATSGVWVDQVAVRFSFANIDWGRWALLPLQIFKDFLPGSLFLLLLWKLPRLEGDAPSSRSQDVSPNAERWLCVIEGGKLAILAGWIILSLSPEFRPRYAMPLFGIASVVVVELFGRLDSHQGSAERMGRWWKDLNRTGLILVALGGVVAMAAAACGWKGLAWWHAWPGLVTGALICLGWRYLQRWQPLLTACVVLAGAQILVFQFSRPWKDQRGLCRPVARSLHEMIPDDGRKLIFYKPGFLRFLFYVQRPYLEVTKLSNDVEAAAGYLAVREPDLADSAVRSLISRKSGVELGRRQIEGGKFVFFALEKKG